MKLRRFAAVLASISLQGYPVAAQQTYQESAQAVLVEVPVRVTDREGNPIRGLGPQQFELYDDGKKQTILGFDTIDLAQKGTEAGEGGRLNPAARRHFLILFDLSFAQPKAVLGARRAAKQFVLSDMGDRDFAAVATFSVDNGIRLLVTFSSDRVQLARAIDTLGISEPSSLASDPLAFVYDIMNIEASGNQGADYANGTSGRRTDAQASALVETIQTLASLTRARLDQYERGRVARMAESLGQLATALDTVQGRKDVIYLSEGFQSRLLLGANETDQERDWNLNGEMWKVDAEKAFGNSNLQEQLRWMTDLFRRSDCVIHAVDVGGLKADPEAASGPDGRSTESSLFEIANPTGGEVFHNDNDFHTQLTRLIARTNLVYVLAFKPEQMGREGRYHELRVKAKVSGAHVLARAGYYEKKTFRALSPLERNLLAADIIANEVPVSDITARVFPVPVPAAEGLAAVPVLIEVPGDQFLAGQKGGHAVAEFYAYAHDSEDRLRDFFAQTASVDLAVSRERLQKGGLKYYGQLTLAPGQYRLRVLVRNAETGRMGLAVESLHVPDFSDKGPYLAPPIFLESAQTGVVVRGSSGARASEKIGREDLSLAAGGEDLAPVVLPEVTPGSPSRFSVVAYNFGRSPADTLRIGAQVLSAEGRPLGEGSIRVIGKSAAQADGRQVLLVSFTPEGLSPGRYALRVFLQDGSTGQGGHASTPFLVR